MPNKRLKILMTADPVIPVPPRLYGGIERVVDFLQENLVRRGHEVHLFAHADSRVSARLVPYRSAGISGSDVWRNASAITAYHRSCGPFDIVHSFGRLAYVARILLSRRVPVVQSYQRSVTGRSPKMARLLGGKHVHFAACSRFCASTSGVADLEWGIIPNGVRLSDYRFIPSVSPSAPLVFLGRLEPIKGAHTAIRVAHATGRRLWIAGNVPDAARAYFENEIKPHCDGKRIVYVGPVDDAAKGELLGNAAALLFPIEWGEPFGIVMAEALACGTPVLALDRGSVPEVIDHGRTGFICRSTQEMISFVARLDALNRSDCRLVAERRFSDGVVTGLYEEFYRSCLTGKRDGS